MTCCHPATAWALMRKGMSLYAIATRYRDDLGDLDRGVWSYRHARTSTLHAERTAHAR